MVLALERGGGAGERMVYPEMGYSGGPGRVEYAGLSIRAIDSWEKGYLEGGRSRTNAKGSGRGGEVVYK